ncbi:MAG: hypothetical protein AB8G05_22450 [Oligoflexales bacterium]
MKKHNNVLGLFFTLVLSIACSTEKPESNLNKSDFHSSDAIARWGSDMMDNQSTSYQSLYLKLTKQDVPSENGESNPELRVWLEGSTQSPETITNVLQANYCLVDQCDYSDLNLESCVAESRSFGAGVECLIYLPLTRTELAQTGSAMLLKVNYCDEVCTEAKLQYSSTDDDAVSVDNRYSGADFVK